MRAIFIVLVGFFLGLPGSAARELTFQQRIAAQQAIDRVYHSYQTGARLAFEQAVPPATAEAKVRRYLRQSLALEQFWGATVTAGALRREVERIGASTAFPDRLRRLYQALDQDPFVVQECLARPLLVDRLARASFAGDATLHRGDRLEGVRTRDWDAWWSSVAPTLDIDLVRAVAAEAVAFPDPLELGSACSPGDGWESISSELAPSGGVAVWSGSHMIVWGAGADRDEGARYDPITDSWAPISTLNAPQGRVAHTAVWTGTEMIVWGGLAPPFTSAALVTGGRYRPLTDSWLPTAIGPMGQRDHTAVWTGNEMIVWGGAPEPLSPVGGTRAGSRYDPLTDVWTPTTFAGAASGRYDHTAVWTGTEMIVWGGVFQSCCESPVHPVVGGRYNPVTDSWQVMDSSGAPAGRTLHAALWTGEEMIISGGNHQPSFVDDTGGRYDPATNAWTSLPAAGEPDLPLADAVWLPPYAVVWGGGFGTGYEGALYDPQLDTWTPVTSDGAPGTTSNVLAIDDGVMLVWSGAGGGRYSFGDVDGDGLCADSDNCMIVANADQTDSDADGRGDACDGCPLDPDDDADADGACANDDNCPTLFNPTQQRLAFGDTLVPPDATALIWTTPADVDFVRGDLTAVGSYSTSDSGTLVGATLLDVSSDAPAPGGGLYYLVRYAAGCGSWQTTSGAEPSRDVALP